MAEQPQKHAIASLDAVRGVAALTVAVWHWFALGVIKTVPVQIFIRDLLFRASEIAVTTFFVLSGLVLTLSIIRSDETGRDPWLQGYFVRRTARIMPLLIAVVTVSMAGMWLLRWYLSVEQAWSKYSIFTFDQWFTDITFRSTHFVPPGWTLLYEVVAYGLLPFLVLALVRASALHRAAALALFFALALFAANVLMLPATFMRLMPMFLPGIALGIIVRYTDLRPNPLYLAVAGIIGIAIVVHFEPKHYDLAFWMASACAVFVAGAYYSSIRVPAPFKWLGDVSYGVYLWHYPIMWALAYLFGSYVGGPHFWPWLWMGAIGLPLTLLVGHFSYVWFELPIMNAAAEYSGRRRQPSAIGEPV